MEKSPLIDKIPPEYRSKIVDTIKVNFFIDQSKTWNTSKSNEVFSD